MAIQPTPRRLQRLEAELAVLKRTMTGKPDFSVDEENWQKVKKTVKKVRRQLFRHAYPAK